MRALNKSDILINIIDYDYVEINSENNTEATVRIYNSMVVEFYLFRTVKCEATFHEVQLTEDAIKDQIIELFKDKLKPDGVQFT